MTASLFPTWTASGQRRLISSRTRGASAASRSVLLIKKTTGIPCCLRARHSVTVWGRTPSQAQTRRTAPSMAHRLCSTSAAKSAWPGVSTRLIMQPFRHIRTAAARTDMPRRFSTGRESVWAVPLSTLPASRMAPVRESSCSVRVVLPASTSAKMPMLRMFMGSSRSPRRQRIRGEDNTNIQEKTRVDNAIFISLS